MKFLYDDDGTSLLPALVLQEQFEDPFQVAEAQAVCAETDVECRRTKEQAATPRHTSLTDPFIAYLRAVRPAKGLESHSTPAERSTAP